MPQIPVVLRRWLDGKVEPPPPPPLQWLDELLKPSVPRQWGDSLNDWKTFFAGAFFGVASLIVVAILWGFAIDAVSARVAAAAAAARVAYEKEVAK